MTTIPKVAAALQAVLTTTAEQAARRSGAVQRTTKFTGATLVQTLVFGWLADPAATLEQLCTMARRLGVAVTPQALDQRFTPALAAGLQAVLVSAFAQVVTADPVAVPLLARFAGVYLFDSTTISLPDALAAVWRGCGGRVPQGGAAALKLQVGLDLVSGRLLATLHDGRSQDQAAPHLRLALPAGTLRIQDLGYFNLEWLAAWEAAGVFFLSRCKVGTTVRTADGQCRPVGRFLATQHQPVVDVWVRLGARARLRCRLIAVRVPPAVAAERRRKLHADAQREGQTVSTARLELADWTVLVTNVPPDRLSVREALVLARARWQIELLFKRWKAGGQVDTWRSAQPWRILCEVYAKLLGQVVQHWLLLTGCWDRPDRSLTKAAAVVRAAAAALAQAVAQAARLRDQVRQVVRLLQSVSGVGRRRQRPALHLLLADPARQPCAVQELNLHRLAALADVA
jgi:hypothetical protein